MKSEGKKFEEDIEKSIPEALYHLRLKDNPGAWGGGKQLRFATKNPYDFLVYNDLNLIGIECKSHKKKSIPFSRFEDHQVKGLEKVNNMQNGKGVFFVNFRDYEETFEIGVTYLEWAMRCEKRKSLSLGMARENGILIKQKLKRVRYSYDLRFLLQKNRVFAINEQLKNKTNI